MSFCRITEEFCNPHDFTNQAGFTRTISVAISCLFIAISTFSQFFLPKFHLYYLTLLWNPHFIEFTAKMYFWFFFRATSCLFSAVEHAYDAIEIQCVDPDKPEFQVGFKFLNQRFRYLFKGFLKETSHKWTSSVYVMRYAIWYHLYNLKTWKTPTEELLLSLQLY